MHYPEVKPVLLRKVDDVKALIVQSRLGLGLTRERFALRVGVPVRVVDDLEDRGVTDIASARRVFASIGVEPPVLPSEFARYVLEHES